MIQETAVFLAMVSCGVGARLGFQEIPNFAPVAALALFAGFFFRSAIVAAAVPLITMAVSDWFVGGYEWRVMLVVYASLTAPVLLGRLLSKSRPESWKGVAIAASGVLLSSLAGSLFFFLASNFAHWLWFGGYDRNLSGLAACYEAAIPFFRYTLAGDLVFATAFFGAFAAAASLGYVSSRTAVPARAA